MNLTNLKFAEYSLQFKSSFQSSKNIFSEKKIILIRLTSDTAREVFGEVSLLPELGTETLEKALHELKKIKKHIENTALQSIDDLKEYVERLDQLPALKFGYEQTLFYLGKKDFHKKTIDISSIIGIDTNERMFQNIYNNYETGFRTFKLKIGEKEFSEDLQLLSLLKEKYHKSIKIRLDVNGKWNYEEAKINLCELENYNIEFVEQPVSNNDELEKLTEKSNIKIAADESANSFENTIEIITNSLVEIIVLKPVLIGSVKKTFELIDLAKKYNKAVVISSTFESAVGMNMLIRLAHEAGNKFAHGLGTSAYLQNDFVDLNATMDPPKLILNVAIEPRFILSNINWQ